MQGRNINETYFPIRIYLTELDEVMVCNSPEDIPDGETFQVLKCNVEPQEEEKMKVDILAGKRTHKKYDHVDLLTLVGKTVEAVGSTYVEAAYGHEPCTVLFFEDGTKHGFVHPANDEDS